MDWILDLVTTSNYIATADLHLLSRLQPTVSSTAVP
jgi:hypothetical protein